MNEAKTRTELIDPALKAASWGVVEASRVFRTSIAVQLPQLQYRM
jgi:type I restriction enzyme R subunit